MSGTGRDLDSLSKIFKAPKQRRFAYEIVKIGRGSVKGTKLRNSRCAGDECLAAASNRWRGPVGARGDFMQLSEVPEIVNWPETHYVFVVKIGPFQNTAGQAWQTLHQLVPQISKHNKITGYTSLYRVASQVYRAGVSLSAEPKNLPAGLAYTKFAGGKYSRFVLTGPYSQLPEASGRVFAIVSEQKLQVRDDFGIENYANDPRTTPEEQLITEILVPTS
jgi:DNA gyrase inhibitor GyrI